MSNHIHTIPVMDALRDPKGCAFCVMQEKLENDVIQFILGPAYMEDDVRMETDKIGFCKKHLQAMYGQQNRLGLALMLHTHIKKLCKDTTNIIDGRMPIKMFGKDPAGVVPRLQAHLLKIGSSCYVCTRADDTFSRYVDTFFHLWSRGGEDARVIESQTSYCIPHFVELLTQVEKMGRSMKEKCLDVLLPLWKNQMQELEGDLDWFVQKFDHRNAAEPWKNSKDVIPRAMGFIEGFSGQ